MQSEKCKVFLDVIVAFPNREGLYAAAHPGCAARPWALMCHAFGESGDDVLFGIALGGPSVPRNR